LQKKETTTSPRRVAKSRFKTEAPKKKERKENETLVERRTGWGGGVEAGWAVNLGIRDSPERLKHLSGGGEGSGVTSGETVRLRPLMCWVWNWLLLGAGRIPQMPKEK